VSIIAEPLVPDEVWEIVQLLLLRRKACPGKREHPPVDDQTCLTSIVFILRSGIPWELLVEAHDIANTAYVHTALQGGSMDDHSKQELTYRRQAMRLLLQGYRSCEILKQSPHKRTWL